MSAPISIGFNLRGDLELAFKLDVLPGVIQKKVLRQALRTGAKLIRDAAKRNIHSITGRAAESLRVRAGKRSRKFPNRVSVLVITASGWFKGPAFYFAFAEFGHRLGHRRLGNLRRLVPGKKWLQRAAKENKAVVQSMVRQAILEGIEREGAKLGKSRLF